MVQDKRDKYQCNELQEFNNYLCKRSVLLPNDNNNDTQLNTQKEQKTARKKILYV